MFYDIEDKILFDPVDICTESRTLYNFELCNNCGYCENE